jgi:hypothetical protein
MLHACAAGALQKKKATAGSPFSFLKNAIEAAQE